MIWLWYDTRFLLILIYHGQLEQAPSTPTFRNRLEFLEQSADGKPHHRCVNVIDEITCLLRCSAALFPALCSRSMPRIGVWGKGPRKLFSI